MSDYIRRIDGGRTQLWRIDDETAVELGVSNLEQSPASFFRATPGASIWELMRSRTSWWEEGEDPPFTKLNLPPQHYYLRIARPFAGAQNQDIWNPGFFEDRRAWASAQGQAAVLTAQLIKICQTIHPEGQNLGAFGHDIRNLLILAATEVEMGLRGVLEANGSTKLQPNTKDYVLLDPILGLGEYTVAFPSFPWLPAVRPFANWSVSDSTKSLAWYDAYNGVKHNREREFERASLHMAFQAVSACAILLVAQFGRKNAMGPSPELRAFFQFVEQPDWPDEDLYAHGRSGVAEWSVAHHPVLAAVAEPPRRRKAGHATKPPLLAE